jgi:type II restriction/modification system DNA methylase subunit YeeA
MKVKEEVKHFPRPAYDRCNAGHILVEVYNNKKNVYEWDCPICIKNMEREEQIMKGNITNKGG